LTVIKIIKAITTSTMKQATVYVQHVTKLQVKGAL